MIRREQSENPPGQSRSAPQGEIREQSFKTLEGFTVVMALAFAMPAIVLIALGIEMGRNGLLYAGIVVFIGLIVFAAIALWKIIGSRPTHFRNSEIK